MTRSTTILGIVLLCVFGGGERARGGDNRVPVCTGVTVAGDVFIGESVAVMANASEPNGDPLTYKWTATCGRIVGSGANVMFEASGCDEGLCTVTAQVSDDYNPPVECSAAVNVKRRPNECLTVSLTADKTSVVPGETVTFTATATDPDDYPGPITYEWTVSQGSLARVTDSHVALDTTGLDGAIEVKVTVSDGDPDCVRTGAVSVEVASDRQ